MHQAKRILCNSESTARDINKIYRIPLNKIKVIKIGFDKNCYYPKDLIRKKFFKRFTPKLKKLAKKLLIDGQCEWRDWVSPQEKLNLLNTCKALYIISLWEGFGLPALEAMACGTKVVSSNRGGLPEIVSGVGKIVNPKDIYQISNSMEEIALKNKIGHEFQKKSLLRSKEYSWKLAAEEICNLIS